MLQPDHDYHKDRPHESRHFLDWIQIIQGPLAITILTSSSTFVAFILLYRQLPAPEAGILTLFFAIVQIQIMVAGLGQPTLILRTYSHAQVMASNWMKDLWVSIMLSMPFIIVISVTAMFIYKLEAVHTILLIITATLQITILIEAQIMNSAQMYAWGSMLVRLPNALLIAPACMLLILKFDSSIDLVLMVYTALSTLVLIAGLGILRAMIPLGERVINWKERVSGFVFLFTQSSYTLPEQANIAIAGNLLPIAQLAVYGSISVILKPFELLAGVLRTILTTELIRDRNQKRSVLIIGLWTLGLLGVILTVLFGPRILDLVYRSRYEDGLILIPWLAIAGLFRVVEVLPRSYIVGNSEQQELQKFVLWQSILAVIILLLGGWAISRSAVIAMAWTMLLIQVGRYLVSLIFFRRTRELETDYPDLARMES